MAKQTIDEVMEDYKDCQRCEGKSCLGMVSNCSKPDSIVQVESELLRTLIAEISLDRLEEICTAEKDGRCVVLPCKVGDDMFSFRWSIKNQKYEVCAGKVKNVRYDTADDLVTVSDGERYCVWGETAFLTPEEAEAALAKEG